ncbi:MAG: hypothetical protein RBS17_05010 [Coriobacteriia bacterium]|nr:hypothetical protein [Coriobacteriia bacterium]MDZ4179168.1 hypothetical protein [Coriobacteriia bacterium]
MIRVQDGLFVGTDRDCHRGDADWAVVHACKHPCHVNGVGYSGKLPSTHPNYLVFETGDDLILNIIDPPIPLFKPELFAAFLSFAQRKSAEGKSILIHCNQGESRAPSLALLYMAKVSGTVSNDSYAAARADFERLFQNYHPGRGIESYLTTNWQPLGEF